MGGGGTKRFTGAIKILRAHTEVESQQQERRLYASFSKSSNVAAKSWVFGRIEVSITPTSGGFDAQSLSGLQLAERLRGQLLAVEEVAPGRAIGAALRALRSMAPSLGDQRVAQRGECLDLPDDAVAALEAAGAARAAPQRVLDHPQRELELERLNGGVERVAHRHVDRARPVGVGARALTAADRLVIDDLF